MLKKVIDMDHGGVKFRHWGYVLTLECGHTKFKRGSKQMMPKKSWCTECEFPSRAGKRHQTLDLQREDMR